MPVTTGKRGALQNDDLWAHTFDQDQKEAELLRITLDEIIAQVQSLGVSDGTAGLVNRLAETIHGDLAIRLNAIELKYENKPGEITPWQDRFKKEVNKLCDDLLKK